MQAKELIEKLPKSFQQDVHDWLRQVVAEDKSDPVAYGLANAACGMIRHYGEYIRQPEEDREGLKPLPKEDDDAGEE